MIGTGGSMTPERIDELMSAVRKAGPHIWGADQSFLLEALAIAKAAITSEKVAEDRDIVLAYASHACADGEPKDECRGCQMSEAAMRLAAQAQSARHAWERQAEKDKAYVEALADRDKHARAAEVWRKRVHDVAEALADVLPAMQGLVGTSLTAHSNDRHMEDVARLAYRMADAMVKEMGKT